MNAAIRLRPSSSEHGPTQLGLTRRDFTRAALMAGAAVATDSMAADAPPRRIRAGLIGCGSVSHHYLPQLTQSRFVEVVSVCDIRPERARRQAEKFKVA